MSLATKYRPKTLNEIIGQKVAVKAIRKDFPDKGERWPSSCLFVGPSGTGKTTLARILADMFAKGAGPSNIVEIDAATNSGAEAMRDVAHKATYKALGLSPNKTIIVDEIHRLSAAAWSSLLKPIEEPPPHVMWVLCTTEAGKILDTIKTRCKIYVLKPVDEVEIFGLLEKINKAEKLNALPEVLEVIAEGSNGSPRQAITHLELCSHAKTANEARELIRSALHMKGPVDLARLLLMAKLGKGSATWADATKLISALENVDAETVRIIIVNYVAGALIKSKGDKEVRSMLALLECFNTPYQTSDKLAPLLMSIGLALGLDQ